MTIICKLNRKEEISKIIGLEVPCFYRGVLGVIKIAEIATAHIKGDDVALGIVLRG